MSLNQKHFKEILVSWKFCWDKGRTRAEQILQLAGSRSSADGAACP